MTRVCQVTGKRPITGNTVSHSNIKPSVVFYLTLQTKRFFFVEEDRWDHFKSFDRRLFVLSTKNGLSAVIKEMRAKGTKI